MARVDTFRDFAFPGEIELQVFRVMHVQQEVESGVIALHRGCHRRVMHKGTQNRHVICDVRMNVSQLEIGLDFDASELSE